MSYPYNRGRQGDTGRPYNDGPSRQYDRNRGWNRHEEVEHEPAPEPFDPAGKKLMVFNGHYYDYARILAQAANGPNAVVESGNLHDGGLTFSRNTFPEGKPDPKQIVIVMPYEGKFVVLAGKDKVKEGLSTGTPVKARLLSKMAAKKAYMGDVI